MARRCIFSLLCRSSWKFCFRAYNTASYEGSRHTRPIAIDNFLVLAVLKNLLINKKKTSKNKKLSTTTLFSFSMYCQRSLFCWSHLRQRKNQNQLNDTGASKRVEGNLGDRREEEGLRSLLLACLLACLID